MEQEMKRLIQSKDWGNSPVGPRESWPPLLETLLNLILHSRFPMLLFWGPELVSFYNDAFKPSLGLDGKHPAMLGSPASEAWAEIWHQIKPLLDQAAKGEAVWHEDLLVKFFRNARIEDTYWTFSYSPVIDADGETRGILVICTETTDKVQTNEFLKSSETRFRNILKQTPVAITIFKGKDLIVEVANEMYLAMVDRTEDQIIGKPFFEVIPEVRESVGGILQQVLDTGTPYYGTEFKVPLNRHGSIEESYFNFVYYPMRDPAGDVSGIIVVAFEVTDQVKAKFDIAESEKKFRELVMKSPIPMTIFSGPDYVIEIANSVMFEKIWRRKESEVIGRKLLDVFPELNDQKYPALLHKVYSTGVVHNEKDAVAYVQGDDGLKKFIFDFEYTPLFNSSNEVWGMIVTVTDVTEKAEARRKIEESQEKLNIVIDASELGVWELNLKTRSGWYSDRYLEILGYNTRVELTHAQLLKHLHPDDLDVRNKALEQAMKSGVLYYVARLVWLDGTVRWIEAKGKLFYDEEGKPDRMLGTIRDITEERNRNEVLEKSEQKFRLLAESIPQLVWTASPEGDFTFYGDLLYQFSGLSPERLREEGLFSVVHDNDKGATLKQWQRSLETGIDFVCEHRFRKSDGSYTWHLSRAVAQRNAAGEILMWVGVSTDIQAQKMFVNELERKVSERTSELEEKNRDLERMNDELKSFAYVSSHDLQEPLRKIQTFASRIREKEPLSEKGADYFSRIQKSANQMQVLIQDLLAYSRTIKAEPILEVVKLTDLVNEVRNDFVETINDKNAVIESDNDLEMKIIPLQFRQVLYNLIGNSLKFSRPEAPPKIKINARSGVKAEELKTKFHPKAQTYLQISISDNGIGFDPQYRERIFEVFQRLHGKHEYSGTGVGLAIVRKIIDNHNGYIEADGRNGEGARFDIYLPVN